MNILGVHGHHRLQSSVFHFSQTTPPRLPISPPPYLLALPISPITHQPKLSLCSYHVSAPISSPSSLSKRTSELTLVKISEIGDPLWTNEEEEEENFVTEDLTTEGEVYEKTLRLVECSMLAALGGLAYILSSSLAIENYFGCFFALPIIFSSMRWDIVAGRKTMVATATLLLVLSGPIKALTYLLMYGFLGLSMGSLWRLRASWGLSICLSSLVRAMGAMGYVLIYSFLIRENILALITINIHASATYIITSLGYCAIPSMNLIYAIFGILLLLNSCFFVFLLHLLYALFFTRLGMKGSLRLPRWLENAL